MNRPTCEQITLAAMAWADGEKAALTPAEVQTHLADCAACRRQTEQLSSLAEWFARERRPEPAVDLWPRIRERLGAAPALAGERTSPGEAIAAEAGRTPGLGWLLAWWTGQRLAWGALGLCWVLIAFFRWSAPENPKDAVTSGPVSLREVLVALEWRRPAEAPAAWTQGPRPAARPLSPPASPRSQGRRSWEAV